MTLTVPFPEAVTFVVASIPDMFIVFEVVTVLALAPVASVKEKAVGVVSEGVAVLITKFPVTPPTVTTTVVDPEETSQTVKVIVVPVTMPVVGLTVPFTALAVVGSNNPAIVAVAE